MPRRTRPIRFRPTAAGALQVDGRAMRTRLGAQRRVRGGGGAGAHLSCPLLPHFRDGVARRDRIIARALLRPRVHLQSATRPTGRCRRHTRARGLLCRSGTHSKGGPTRLEDTHTLPHDALRMRLPAHSAETVRVALQAQPLLAATKEVRPLAVRVGVGGGAREYTRGYRCERTTRRAGAFWGSFLCQKPILERFPPQ